MEFFLFVLLLTLVSFSMAVLCYGLTMRFFNGSKLARYILTSGSGGVGLPGGNPGPDHAVGFGASAHCCPGGPFPLRPEKVCGGSGTAGTGPETEQLYPGPENAPVPEKKSEKKQKIKGIFRKKANNIHKEQGRG